MKSKNQNIHKINNTLGVLHIVRFGNNVPIIKGNIIAKMMTKINQDSDNLLLPKFESGQKVRIKNGPFANFVGKIEDLSNENRV